MCMRSVVIAVSQCRSVAVRPSCISLTSFPVCPLDPFAHYPLLRSVPHTLRSFGGLTPIPLASLLPNSPSSFSLVLPGTTRITTRRIRTGTTTTKPGAAVSAPSRRAGPRPGTTGTIRTRHSRKRLYRCVRSLSTLPSATPPYLARRTGNALVRAWR